MIFNNTIVFVYIITKMASLHMQHAHLQKTATFDVICLTIYTSCAPPPLHGVNMPLTSLFTEEVHTCLVAFRSSFDAVELGYIKLNQRE